MQAVVVGLIYISSENTSKTHTPYGVWEFLAPQKEFESPTFRLGGGRSILLSYWGICRYILPNFFVTVKKIRHIFSELQHIMHR